MEYFKSLGSSTDPEPNADIVNCFKIGYYEAGDAMRAVRKNGDIIAGSWMVGAKLAVRLSSFPLSCSALLTCVARIPPN